MKQTLQPSKHTVIIMMGVSGVGKSTLGALLAKQLELPFFDGDDYHSEANISKMSQGDPLTDLDRHDWLQALNTLATQQLKINRTWQHFKLKNRYCKKLLQSYWVLVPEFLP